MYVNVCGQSKKALKNLLQKCVHLPALEPLLHDAPPNILKHVVGQFGKVLPHDAKARRLFVTSGALKKVQEVKAEPGSTLAEHINTINGCFPDEIVKLVGCFVVSRRSVSVTVGPEGLPALILFDVSQSPAERFCMCY